jgi:uncharacterized protein (DUF1778 family)
MSLKPPRKPREPRVSHNLALTAKEKAMFDAAASVSGETRSSWMRRTLIEAARKAVKESERDG